MQKMENPDWETRTCNIYMYIYVFIPTCHSLKIHCISNAKPEDSVYFNY